MAIICVCNNFNDKAVKTYLDKAVEENRAVDKDDLYTVCSGGKLPQCFTCYDTVLEEMVQAHNARILPSPAMPHAPQ